MAPAQLGGKQAGSLFLLPKVTWWPDFSALPKSAHPALCLLLFPPAARQGQESGAGLEALPASSLLWPEAAASTSSLAGLSKAMTPSQRWNGDREERRQRWGMGGLPFPWKP